MSADAPIPEREGSAHPAPVAGYPIAPGIEADARDARANLTRGAGILSAAAVELTMPAASGKFRHVTPEDFDRAATWLLAAAAALTAAGGASDAEPWVVVDADPDCDPAQAFYCVNGWGKSTGEYLQMTLGSAVSIAAQMIKRGAINKAVAVPLSRAASVARGGR